jgi:hypothetical protein
VTTAPTQRNQLPFLIALLALLGTITGVPAQQAGSSPVKIFILAGQSNMEGQGEISPATTAGTLGHAVANDPGGDYQYLVDGGGAWVVRDDVWIRDESPAQGGLTVGYGATTSTIGPELGFGHLIGDLNEQQVLIVKAAWGGKSLAVDFRPPSSGGTTGFYYNEILRLVGEATTNLASYFPDYDGGGYEIAGFCWHQGWNDRVTGSYSSEYQTNMANFIRDMRGALGVADLPFVIATTGMDGGDAYTEVEQAQLAMANPTTYPDFDGNVAVIDTRGSYEGLEFWQPAELSPADQGYHWNRNAKTYLHIGQAMADAMSILAPGRCPFRPRAVGAPSGVTLSWQNGTETPTSVRILRNGVEIAAAAPTDPPIYLDSTALPGALDYELQFTMPVAPCDPLTTSFDGGITGLTITPGPGGLTLNWTNNMGYTAIEIRRDGGVLTAALSGTATSYTDTAPPGSGTITYTVAPTTGTSTPASAQINLDLACQLGVLDPYIANGGVNPATGLPWAEGDTYRLVFVTSGTTTCDSPNIATYNSFVQGLANAAGLGGATWKVVGSTAAVAARDNTNTNPGVDGVGEPILRMDGMFVIANNYADLWNGINNSHVAGGNYLTVHLDENGVVRTDERVRTGSSGNGTAAGDGRVLGGSAEATPRVQTGRNFAPDFYGGLGGNSWMQDWSEEAASAGRVYTMSEPLTIVNLADNGEPTLVSITDDKPGGSVTVPGTVAYTVTFSEPMSAGTVDIGDFENDPGLTTVVTIDSAVPTANPAVFLVTVGTTEAGSLRLRIKAGAVLTDLAGNQLDSASALPDDTTIVVSPAPALTGQLGILDVANANGGINPATGLPWAKGDTYRLIFVTSGTTVCDSADIATYNAFVQGLADAAGLGSVTWKVVGSTAAVAARDNTNTNPGVDGVGEPILRMDGTFIIANNYADLWNGINNSHVAGENYLSVHLDENGVERVDERVRTGSDGNGTASTDAGRVLGGSAEATPRVTTGSNFAPDFYGGLGGNNWMRDWSEDAASAGRVYAMSEPLTVRSTAAGGDFASWISNPGFGIAPGDQGFGTDADGDGLANGVEAWFGTNPGAANAGLTEMGKTGNVFRFQHPEADPPLSDVSGSYEWSIDLSAWHAPGTVGDTTVVITALPDTPAAGTTTVEADTAGSVVPPVKLFVRGVATEN